MGRRPGVPRVRLDADHGNVYQFDFKLNGKRHRGSTGIEDETKAQEWINDYHAKVVLGRPVIRPREDRVKVAAPDALERLVDSFKQHLDDQVARGNLRKSYTRKIKQHLDLHVLPRFASIYDMLEPGALDAMFTHRLSTHTLYRSYERDGRIIPSRSNKPHPKRNTVHREQVSIRRFLKWARAAGHIRELPAFESVDQTSDYTAPDILPEEVEALLEALPDRHTHKRRMPVREYFTVLWAQALRSDAEAGTLRWCDVNLRRKELTVRAIVAKNGRPRTLKMDPETYAVLSEMHRELRKQGPILETSLIFGRHNHMAALKSAARRLGLPAMTRHLLRHARLTELGNSPGTALAALQYFAGHLHTQTTDRYIKSRTAATGDMLDALNRSPK
jgi:integrase